MIYLIGDTHGDLDRIRNIRLKKTDFLIICGDFGFIWNGTKKEKRILKRLGKRRFPILFVDGAHENHKILAEYPVEDWSGGKVQKISGNLRRLMRGQVFDLGGEIVFSLGGGSADDDDALLDDENKLLAAPSMADLEEGISNLSKHSNKVDYVVSFEAPSRITEFLELPRPARGLSMSYIDALDAKLEFKRWFFGCYHINKIITAKYFAVFDKLMPSNYTPHNVRSPQNMKKEKKTEIKV